MKTPLFFTRQRLIPFALVSTLVLVVAGSRVDRALGDETDPQPPALAGAIELEAIENQSTKLEQDLEAQLWLKLDALGDDVSRASMGALTAVHDARLSDQVDARSEALGAGHSPASATEHEILAADRSWKIVITRVPREAPPAAPAH